MIVQKAPPWRYILEALGVTFKRFFKPDLGKTLFHFRDPFFGYRKRTLFRGHS